MNTNPEQPQNVPVNLQVHPLFVDILNATKAWLSKQPLNAFKKRLSTKTSLILFAIEGLLTIFTMLVSSSNILSRLPIIGSSFSYGNISAKLFLPLLIILGIYYSLLSLTVMVMAKIVKTPASSFTDAMSLVSISLIPISILSFAGFFLGFISSFLSFILMFIYLILFPITLYMGLQVHLGKPTNSPYWIFPIGMLVLALIMSFFISITTAALAVSEFSNQRRNIESSFRNPFNGGNKAEDALKGFFK